MQHAQQIMVSAKRHTTGNEGLKEKVYFCPKRKCRAESHLLGLLVLLDFLRHAEKPVQHHSPEDVEEDEHPHDTKVPPSVAVVTADSRQEHIGLGDLAVGAIGRRVGVLEVSTSKADVVCHEA